MIHKCLIIGLGQIGMGYDLELDPLKAIYTHARAFSMHPSFELTGAIDPAKKRRDLFEAYFNKPAYPELASALQVQKASVVVIAAPTILHSSLILELLTDLTPKAILCEKPLAYELNDTYDIVEACENKGVKLFVNYIRRADAGAVEIKKRIDSGKIASPIKGVVWYSKGLLHNGSHFFNLLEFWLGAYTGSKILDSGRPWGDYDSEPDVQVEFERGKAVFLAAWEERFSHYTIELLSPTGRLRYEQGGESITWQPTQMDPKITGYEILHAVPEIVTNNMNYYQWHVADQLANALENKPYSLCTGRQSLSTHESIHKIIKQIQS